MKRELQFAVNGLTLSAQAWGDESALPVLALHGWLDNSASFEALATRLPDVHLVALDLAGHGKSDHRPGSGPYNIWDDVGDLFEVADQLGWKRFSLLGHSRGGIIGMLAAGTFPERVTDLALVESLWPEVHRPEDAPRQLARSILETRALKKKSLTVYRDFERAIRARERGMFPLSHAAARALTERGVRAVEGGYTWSSDQRLLLPSSAKYTEAELEAFLARSEARMCQILGHSGIPKLFPHYRDALARFPERLQWLEVPGGHHLHLEAEAPGVADCLKRFFAGRPLA